MISSTRQFWIFVLLLGLFWSLGHSVVLAASPGRYGGGTAKVLIIGGVVVSALLVGMLLFYFSQQTSQVRFHEGSGDGSLTAGLSPEEESEFMPVIMDELNQLPVSSKQRQQVARSMHNMMNRAMDQRIEITKDQMNQQYGKVLDEQKKVQQELKVKYSSALHEKQQTSQVLSSIAEGLVVVNNKGEVVMMNPAAEKLIGNEQKGAAGSSLRGRMGDQQLMSMVSGEGEDKDIVLDAKAEETKKVLRASNAMITDENGNTVGMVSVLSDVTKQREVDQLKADFLSTVSHELRTPIVAMQHALAILFDQVAGPLSDEQKKFVQLSQRNLERLNVLINDLLDLSKLESKKMQMRFELGAVEPVIQTVVDSMEHWAKSKAIALVKKVARNTPEIHFDQTRITQVLTNLVGNSIKFTPNEGRITIEAKPVGHGEVQISVSDTGVGIAEEDIPKLFNKFQQVGERHATDIQGTGLGLAISKEIVESHKGKIWVESDAGKGTKFIFTLVQNPSAAA